MTSTDFNDPARLMRAAVARINEALADFEETGAGPEALEALEKAHYRIENAQRSLADAYTDGLADGWVEVADAIGMTRDQARARFPVTR